MRISLKLVLLFFTTTPVFRSLLNQVKFNESISEGAFLGKDSTKRKCSSNCLVCEKETKNCTKCDLSSPKPHLKHSQCFSECGSGYFPDPINKICNLCPEGCDSCESARKCLKLKNRTTNGLKSISNKIAHNIAFSKKFFDSYRILQNSQETQNNSCPSNLAREIKCARDSSSPKTEECVCCYKHCKTCQTAEFGGLEGNGNCLECEPGFELKEGFCYKICTPPEKLHKEPNECSDCDPSCKTCQEENKNICTSCYSRGIKNGDKCLDCSNKNNKFLFPSLETGECIDCSKLYKEYPKVCKMITGIEISINTFVLENGNDFHRTEIELTENELVKSRLEQIQNWKSKFGVGFDTGDGIIKSEPELEEILKYSITYLGGGLLVVEIDMLRKTEEKESVLIYIKDSVLLTDENDVIELAIIRKDIEVNDYDEEEEELSNKSGEEDELSELDKEEEKTNPNDPQLPKDKETEKSTNKNETDQNLSDNLKPPSIQTATNTSNISQPGSSFGKSAVAYVEAPIEAVEAPVVSFSFLGFVMGLLTGFLFPTLLSFFLTFFQSIDYIYNLNFLNIKFGAPVQLCFDFLKKVEFPPEINNKIWIKDNNLHRNYFFNTRGVVSEQMEGGFILSTQAFNCILFLVSFY